MTIKEEKEYQNEKGKRGTTRDSKFFNLWTVPDFLFLFLICCKQDLAPYIPIFVF